MIQKLKSLGRKQKIILFSIIVFLTLSLGGFLYYFRDIVAEKRFYTFTSVSEVNYGKNGHILVVDNSKKTVLILDAEGGIVSRYEGGEVSRPFYYATHLAEDAKGNLILSDITYGDRGNLIDSERILRIRGGRAETLVSFDYTDPESPEHPLQYGNILELQENGGAIYYTLSWENELHICRLTSAGGTEEIRTIPLRGRLSDASYDCTSGAVVLAYRTGEVTVSDAEGQFKTILEAGDRIVYDVAISNRQVYMTEILSGSIQMFRLDEESEPYGFYEEEIPLYQLNASAEDGNLVATDYGGFETISAQGEFGEYYEQAEHNHFGRVVMLRILAGIVFAVEGVILIYLIAKLIRRLIRDEKSLRVLFIVATAVLVTVSVSYLLMGQINDSKTSNSREKAELLGLLMKSEIDVDRVLEINGPSDYESEAFYAVKNPLDQITREQYEKEEYFYYMIYRADEENFWVVMDYEDSNASGYVYCPYGEEPYTTVYETGETVATSEITAYGAWTFVQMPLKDRQGNIVAVLEVGQNLDKLLKEQKQLVDELIINSIVSVIVITMLLMEVAFLLDFMDKRRKTPLGDLDPVDATSLRSMMFILYLVDSMQDAFIALLCSQLYTGGLPISDGVAVALPMSAQLLVMAAISLVVGKLVDLFGTRGTMVIGMGFQLAGYLCCLIMGNYFGILIGKILVGAGMGIVYVDCNTIAANGRTEEKIGEGFAAVAAGTLSGLTIGGGLASILFSIGGWKSVYLVGSVIVGMGMLLAFASGTAFVTKKEAVVRERNRAGLKAFLGNRHVLPFFVLMLIPFMMSLSFREYFFPFVAADKGVTEVQIGQIYLMCGIVVLYLGPHLTAWILKKFGAYRGIVTVNVLMAITLVLYVIYPNYISAVIGVVLLSLNLSFAYSCQYTYFEQLDEAKAYGEGAAMGMYSVMESVGQTLGPLAYGVLLSFGYREGIGIGFVVMTVFTILFVVITGRKGRRVKDMPSGENSQG